MDYRKGQAMIPQGGQRGPAVSGWEIEISWGQGGGMGEVGSKCASGILPLLASRMRA